MSAPAFPYAALIRAVEGRGDDHVSAPIPVHVLLSAIAAYAEAVRQATITQEAATVAQLAHEWARARRERLTLGPVRREPCAIEPNCGTCVDGIRDGYKLVPCSPCEETIDRMLAKGRLAAKLSGLARRLERACLGPRPKKEE